jgi:hypothetical protein
MTTIGDRIDLEKERRGRTLLYIVEMRITIDNIRI